MRILIRLCLFVAIAVMALGNQSQATGIFFDDSLPFNGSLDERFPFTGSSNGGGLPGGRAGGNADFFAYNVDFGISGFGGIDQVAGNGNPGLFANNGARVEATFFSTPGATSPFEIPPSGQFDKDLPLNHIVDFSFKTTNNGDIDGPATITEVDFNYSIGLLLNGNTTLPADPAVSEPGYLALGSGTVTDPAGAPAVGSVSGSAVVTEAATSYNLLVVIDNPDPGGANQNDQVQIDDIVLTHRVPEPGTLLLGSAGLCLLGMARRRK